MANSKLLKKCQYFIQAVLLATITYPILCLTLLPIAVYRYVIRLSVQLRDPKVGDMLTGIDALFAGSDPYDKPVVQIAPYIPFKNKIERATVIKTMEENAFKPNHFPNLRQRIVQRFGYHFWYQVDNFSVENHVRYMNPHDPEKAVTREEMRLWAEEACRQPFDRNRSPWEWILIPNFIDINDPSVKSLAMLRVNHCLMDGYSFHVLGKKLSPESWISPEEEIQKLKPIKKKDLRDSLKLFFQLVITVLTGPYHVFEILSCNDNNKVLQNALSKSHEEKRFAWLGKIEEIPLVPIDRLRTLKKEHDVGMTALITSLVCLATGKFISKRFEQIPEKMYIMLSYPMPNHPVALTNHWCSVKIPVKVFENDPVKTMKDIQRQFERYVNSPAPLVSFYIGKLTGMLPIMLLPELEKLGAQTMILVNFPGPLSKPTRLFECDCEEMNFMASTAAGTGFAFSSVSMSGMFRFTAGVLETLVKCQDDAEDLSNYILSSLKDLEAF